MVNLPEKQLPTMAVPSLVGVMPKNNVVRGFGCDAAAAEKSPKYIHGHLFLVREEEKRTGIIELSENNTKRRYINMLIVAVRPCRLRTPTLMPISVAPAHSRPRHGPVTSSRCCTCRLT